MVIGVTTGFSKELSLVGLGFKVVKKGSDLDFSLGYSHNIIFPAVEGIDFNIDGNKLTVSGIDKQLVGQVASNIRSLKVPDAYKNKGIRYTNERLVKKAGKSVKK